MKFTAAFALFASTSVFCVAPPENNPFKSVMEYGVKNPSALGCIQVWSTTFPNIKANSDEEGFKLTEEALKASGACTDDQISELMAAFKEDAARIDKNAASSVHLSAIVAALGLLFALY